MTGYFDGDLLLGIAQFRDAKGVLDHVNGLYARQLLRRARVDGRDAAMRDGGVDHARVEHPRQMDVGRVLAAA